MYNKDNCPNCNVSFIGEKIPDNIASSYTGTHWKREIGIDGFEYGLYDGVVAIMCPDCKHTFPRSNHPVALEMFESYKRALEKK